MGIELHHQLEQLHRSLLGGKLPRNLSWALTLELIGHLGSVEPHTGDESVFVVGSHRAIFKHPHAHELGTDEVSRLRKFLRDATPMKTAVDGQPVRMVVVMDHHGARVYQDFDGNRPELEKSLLPDDPFGFHHHLLHRKEAHYKGEHVPEEASFYDDVAAALMPAAEIVLIGHGTGKSSAVAHLAEHLRAHHPDTSKHVIATETADLSALTDAQIEAIAKRHMISVI